jgi:glycine/D-amino acid oxidase-like deaminating enzyme
MLAAAPLLGVAGSREVAVTSTLIGKQAVVIGAGMGGLAAAGALSDCFEQVFVLERDTLPSEPAYRVGTPQARHVHALLLSGQRALGELFPGFEQDLARADFGPWRLVAPAYLRDSLAPAVIDIAVGAGWKGGLDGPGRREAALRHASVDWRRAANKVSVSPMRQCYMNGGGLVSC